MPNNIPPTGNTPPVPDQPSSSKAKSKNDKKPVDPQEGQRQTLEDLLSQCTPEEKKKFWDLMLQNISRDIRKQQDKAIKRLKRQRTNPEDPTGID